MTDAHNADSVADEVMGILGPPPPAVGHRARYQIQQALWEMIRSGDNEWTTWTDCVALAEAVAERLTSEGFEVHER